MKYLTSTGKYLISNSKLLVNQALGWLGNWKYRVKIIITNQVAENLTNFPVAVDLDTVALVEGGKLRSNFADFKVTKNDGKTAIDFYREYGAGLLDESNWYRWIENPVLSGTSGQWDAFWIHPNSIIDIGTGTYYMFYSGVQTVGTPNQIGLATSSDGLAWSKYASNPIFTVGSSGTWDDNKVDHLTVLRESNTDWKGWYAGESGDGVWRIGYATSTNGVNWTRYINNPIITGTPSTWDAAFVVPSCIFKEGSTYYLYYWGGTSTVTQSTWKLGLATSSDGITWTKSPSNPVLTGSSGWDAGILDVDVQKIGNTYVMFYQGNLADGSASAIGTATSTNKTTWSKSADNPFPKSADWDAAWNEGPVLHKIGNTWFMYYMGTRSYPITALHIGVMQYRPTRLWVELPTLSASTSEDIYIYYGNTGSSDLSNGSSVFTFFDDFTGGTPYTQWVNAGSFTNITEYNDDRATKGASNTNTHYVMTNTGTVFSPPLILETWAKVGDDWLQEYSWNYRLYIITGSGANEQSLYIGHYRDASTNAYYLDRVVNGAVANRVTFNQNIAGNSWTTLKLKIPASGSQIAYYHDDRRSLIMTGTLPSSVFSVQISTSRGAGTSSYTAYFDKIRIRKYAETDPTISIGEEETQA